MALVGVSLLLFGGGADDPPPATATHAMPAAGGSERHADLTGPHFDGAVSTITEDEIGLYILPPRAEEPRVTIEIPPDLQRELDLAHMRADASGGVNFRIFYRREGERYVMRGYTHPGKP